MRRLLNSLAYVAVGAAAGAAIGQHAIKLLRPDPSEQIFHQMVTVFEEAAGKQEQERIERQRERDQREAAQRKAATANLAVFRKELPLMPDRIKAFNAIADLTPRHCVNEYYINSAYREVHMRLANFDEQIERGERSGPILRDAKEREENGRVIGQHYEAVQKRCKID